MWRLLVTTFFLGASAITLDGTVNSDGEFEARVAFKCGRPSMYQTRQGWQVDRAQPCLQTADDVLAYCSMKFTRLEVTNVIPSAAEEVIDWPTFGDNETQPFTVRPYRCIVGSFESDALVVPEGCQYGTEPTTTAAAAATTTTTARCASYFDWNTTSVAACEKRGLTLYAFGVVNPCGVATFSATEYVCCPPAGQSVPTGTGSANASTRARSRPTSMPKSPRASTPRSTAAPSRSTPGTLADDGEYLDDYNYDENDYEDWGYENPDENFEYDDEDDEEDFDDADADTEVDDAEFNYYEDEDEEEEPEEYINSLFDDDDYDANKNYYQIYMDTPEQLGITEHEAYTKAVRYVKRYYDSEKQRLMQQLAEVELRADELDAKNITVAMQIRSQGITTIRQLYDTTDKTWKKVKQAMYNEHQMRVETRLENSRLDREDTFNEALEDAAEFDDLNALAPLLRSLKQYIRAEEKERIHWIDRYERLIDTDPAAAERIRLTVEEMLRQIQKRLDSVALSLKRVPRIETSARQTLAEFMNSYADVDQEVRLLFPDFDLFRGLADVLPKAVTLPPVSFADDDDGIAVVGHVPTMQPAFLGSGRRDSYINDVTVIVCFVVAGVLLGFAVTVTIVGTVRYCRRKQAVRRHSIEKHSALNGFAYDRSIVVPMSPSPRNVYASLTGPSAMMHGIQSPFDRDFRLTFKDSDKLLEHDALDAESSSRVA